MKVLPKLWKLFHGDKLLFEYSPDITPELLAQWEGKPSTTAVARKNALNLAMESMSCRRAISIGYEIRKIEASLDTNQIFGPTQPRDKPMNIEQEIQTKGLTAPRITPADIEANIASEHYFTAANGVYGAFLASSTENGAEGPQSLSLLTFCVLVLRNGFTVTGESACASPENFDADLGKQIARQNAVAKIWPLMGYELRTKLAEDAKALAAVQAV